MPSLWLPLLLSAVPLFEGRYALPLAIVWGFPAPLAYLLCTVINLAVIPAVFMGMKTVFPPLRYRWGWVDKLFRFMLRRKLRRRHFAALFTFVALPLPGTGAYTGSLLAFMLGMSDWRSLATLALGVLTANALTTLTAVGILHWF